MKLEHFALNVIDPVAMATWYVEHLGLTTVRQVADAPYTHFLADSSGKIHRRGNVTNSQKGTHCCRGVA